MSHEIIELLRIVSDKIIIPLGSVFLGAYFAFRLNEISKIKQEKLKVLSYLKLVKKGTEKAKLHYESLYNSVKDEPPKSVLIVPKIPTMIDTSYFENINRPLLVQHCGIDCDEDINHLKVSGLEEWNRILSTYSSTQLPNTVYEYSSYKNYFIDWIRYCDKVLQITEENIENLN